MKPCIVKQGGFSLVELLTVVGIIGVLMAVGIPVYAKHQRKVRDTIRYVTARELHKFAMIYDQVNGNGPTNPMPGGCTVPPTAAARVPGTCLYEAVTMYPGNVLPTDRFPTYPTNIQYFDYRAVPGIVVVLVTPEIFPVEPGSCVFAMGTWCDPMIAPADFCICEQQP